MYCILLDSSRPHYIPFLKILLEKKPNSFKILEYNGNINSIKWDLLKEYDYTLILNRFCYVNFGKLIDFCEKNQPSFAALSTYWGVGFPYLSILSKDTISIISEQHENYTKYFDDPVENLYINIILSILGLPDVKELLSKSEEDLQQLFSEFKIKPLDNECYLNNIDYTTGYFHSSIFIVFNDTEDYFINFLEEYGSGKKYIKYKQKPYHLTIGERFFVIKNYHVGVLDSTTMVFWDRESSSWKKAGTKLSNKITRYITKNFDVSLDFSSSRE